MTAAAAGHGSSGSGLAAGDGDNVVRLDGISKRFPVRRPWAQMLRHPLAGHRVTVLDEICCEVRRGEFFGLLGPNGAGKTTLFKILATLVLPDGGRAEVLGRDVVTEASGVREVLAPVIADERSLYWRLTARGNLELFAALYSLSGAESERRIGELLARVGLDGTGAKLVGEFSSGMKQRLLLARALLAEPEILLLDEPTRSLDPLSAREFRAFLRDEIAGRMGCTIVLATHNSEEAFGLCDRVAVLDRGRLLAVGTAEELEASYGDETYRVWAREVDERTLSELLGRGTIRGFTVGGVDEGGWLTADMEIPGGMAEASSVLSALSRNGAGVARFERIPLSLADLLERIVARRADR